MKILMESWDDEALDMPVLKPGQIHCEHCLKVSNKKTAYGWMYFHFENLLPAWLCEICSLDHGPNFQNFQFENRSMIHVAPEVPISQ